MSFPGRPWCGFPCFLWTRRIPGSRTPIETRVSHHIAIPPFPVRSSMEDVEISDLEEGNLNRYSEDLPKSYPGIKRLVFCLFKFLISIYVLGRNSIRFLHRGGSFGGYLPTLGIFLIFSRFLKKNHDFSMKFINF